MKKIKFDLVDKLFHQFVVFIISLGSDVLYFNEDELYSSYLYYLKSKEVN